MLHMCRRHLHEEEKGQLTKKVALLVFNRSATAASPPGVVRLHLGLELGVVLLLLFFLSCSTLLSLFDLDTRGGRKKVNALSETPPAPARCPR